MIADHPTRPPAAEPGRGVLPPELTAGQADRLLGAIVTQMSTECAALADALAAVTHEFQPHPHPALASRGRCGREGCLRGRDWPTHRTPAAVRAALDGTR